MRIAVYTAIVNDKVNFKIKPFELYPDIDYLFFTDNPDSLPKGWKLVPCHDHKKPKVLAHMTDVSLYDYSIWMDATLELKVHPKELIKLSEGAHISTLSHGVRDCAYAEGKALMGCNDYRCPDEEARDRIRRQLEFLRKEGYPEHNGLSACGLLIRKNSMINDTLNEVWWDQIQKFSKRDQVSFNYCCWKLGIKPKIIGNLRKTELIKWHIKKRI